MSAIGTEYLAVFACANANIFGSSSNDKAYYEKIVKKTLLHFKQRDAIDQSKRSVFYCIMLKTILSLAKLEEF